MSTIINAYEVGNGEAWAIGIILVLAFLYSDNWLVEVLAITAGVAAILVLR